MIFPNVWPDGGIFAFSGADGETNWRWPLLAVPTVGKVGLDLYIANQQNHLHRKAKLDLSRRHGPGAIENAIIFGDAIHLPSSKNQPETILAWQNNNTLVGLVRNGSPSLHAVDGASVNARNAEVSVLPTPEGGGIILATAPHGVFALSYNHASLEAGVQQAQSALTTSPYELLQVRARYQKDLLVPSDLDASEVRLARKCAAVLKANVESPQGAIKMRWTTPDRLPHRNMWLWDSAFHALGLVYFDPVLAQEAILAPLSRIRDDGMLPHMMAPDPRLDSEITQPPILAWAAWKIYQQTKDSAFLEAVYEPASRYLRWDLQHRKRGELLGWLIEDDPLCKCGESGLDNSPRFDNGDTSGTVDFSSEAALEAEALSLIATALEKTLEAQQWREVRTKLIQAVEAILWDERRSIYKDLAADPAGGLNPIETHIAFLPLTAGIPSPARAQRLVTTLCDPQRFWTPMPVPSTSRDDPCFSDDMWRGPTWVNINYLIIEGLRRYGYFKEAGKLARKTLAGINRGYEAEGVLFEFFDAEGRKLSGDLHRKGRLGRQEASTLGVIRDYGWTASVGLRLLMEGTRLS